MCNNNSNVGNYRINQIVDIILQVLIFAVPFIWYALKHIGVDVGDGSLLIIYYPICVFFFTIYTFKRKFKNSVSKKRTISEIVCFLLTLSLYIFLFKRSLYTTYLSVCVVVYGILHILLFKGFSKWWWLSNAILNLMILFSLVWVLQNAQAD